MGDNTVGVKMDKRKPILNVALVLVQFLVY